MSNSAVKYLLSLLVTGWIVCLDQASKIFVHTQMKMDEPFVVIKGFFNIAYIRNAGGAFGLFSESADWLRVVLFLFFPLVAGCVIFVMLKETKNRFQTLALSFILGGALGNYIDRIRLGYVVDFIDWYVKDWHWPTFNIADSFIVTGVSILLFFYILERKQVSS